MHLTFPNPQSLFSVTRVIHVPSRPTRSSLLSFQERNFAFLSFFYSGPADKSTTTATATSTPPPFVRSRRPLFPRCYYLCTVRGTRHSIIFSSIFTTHPSPPILISRKCRGEAKHGCARVRKTPVRTSGPFRLAHMQT